MHIYTTPYTKIYKPSFQKIIIDNPEDFDKEVMFNVMTKPELVDAGKKIDINIQAQNNGICLYTNKMKPEQGYFVQGYNSKDLLESIEKLRGSEVLKTLKTVTAQIEAEKEQERFYKEKIHEALEEINKNSLKLVLEQKEKLPDKLLYDFVSNKELHKVCNEYPIKVTFSNSPESKHGEMMFDTDITLLKRPSVRIRPEVSTGLKDIKKERMIRQIEQAINEEEQG